ncbi:hypothetical protein JCM3774_006005 [Rhodotorula dairenensis]
MSDAVAGPSSSTSAEAPHSESSPVRISRSAGRPVEPYDSPLREGDPFGSRGTAGQATEPHTSHGIPARGGDQIETVIYSKRDSKGKGKATAIEHQHVLPEVRIPVQAVAETDAGADADHADDEAEERRIQENLAKWSKADSERRAALRRRHGQSTIVPPPAIPGASDLIRRTSTLLRTASQRRRPARGRSGPSSSGLTEEELELAVAAGRVHSPVLPLFNDAARRTTTHTATEGEDLAARRDRRMMSLRLDSNVDLATQQDPALQSASAARSTYSLSRVGEEIADDDPLKTPTSENPPPRHAYPGDPFSGPSSQVSLVSTDSTTPRHTRGGSVFIENLPPLPQSPMAISPAAAKNPFATPQTSPVKSSDQPHPAIRGSAALRPIQSSSSFSSRDPDNPFIDVVVTSPSPAKPPNLSAPSSSGHTRPGSTSQHSLVSLHSSPPRSPTRATTRRSYATDPYPADTAGAADDTMSGYRPPSPAYSASSNPASPLQGTSGPRRRRSYDPRTDESATYDGRRGRDGLAGRGSPQLEDQQRQSELEVGWLSWLFCGCLRPENEDGARDRDAVIEQRGRTNPME